MRPDVDRDASDLHRGATPQLSLHSPGAREAYLVSWLSMGATLAAVAVGLVTSRVSGSPAMLGFALENVVDALSSAVCLWRWWGGGLLLLPEDELMGRERRAGAAIAIAFVVLGVLVAVNAMDHLAAGEEVEHRDLLGAVGALGTLIFLPLGAIKLHIGTRMDSGSLRKDGLCSLSGGLLSLGVWVSSAASDAWWWLDALVAMAVAAALVWYGREELRALDGRWRRLEFWREAGGKTVSIEGVQEIDGWTQQVDDPDELL